MVVAADVQDELVGNQLLYGKLIVVEHRLAWRLQREKGWTLLKCLDIEIGNIEFREYNKFDEWPTRFGLTEKYPPQIGSDTYCIISSFQVPIDHRVKGIITVHTLAHFDGLGRLR